MRHGARTSPLCSTRHGRSCRVRRGARRPRPRQGARRAFRRGRPRALPGGRQRARSGALAPLAGPGLHHERAPVRHHRDPARLGGPSVPGGGDVRHGRCDEAGPAAGDHHLPPGGLRRGAPQALGHVRQGSRHRPVPPGLHDQRDGDRPARRRVRRPLRRYPPPRARRSSTRRWTPRSRSPTIHCGWCVRRGSWPSSMSRRPSGWWTRCARCAGGSRSSRPSASATSSTSCWSRPRPGKGLELLVETGVVRRVPARTLRDAARTGSRAPAQGRAAPHLRRRRADRTRPDAAHRGAAPRRPGSPPLARSPTTACSSTITRWWAPAWRTSACANSAIPTT